MNSVIDNKYVIFKLDKEYYGIPINNVIYIERMQETTRVPNGPNFLKGVINLRGEVIPLIDLRQKLNIPTKKSDNNSRIIVVQEEEIIIGLIVDSSSEVMEIPKDDIDNPPTSYENEQLSYIYGVGKTSNRIVILLELQKIIEF